MTNYSWDGASPVAGLEIATPKKGPAAAVIRLSGAAAEADGARLAALPEALRAQGFAVIADRREDGTPILRIPRVASNETLLETLRASGAVTGDGAADTARKKQTFGEKWKQNSGKIAGYTYLGGDLFMAAGGIARETEGFKREAMPKGWKATEDGRQGWKDILEGQFSTGWLWLVGGIGLGRYGKEPEARKQERLLYTTSEFFWRESVDVPERSVLHAKETKTARTGFKKFEDVMYRFPTEFLNLFFVIGSAFLAKAGWKKNDDTGQRNYGKFASGLLVGLGGLNGILFKPKKTEGKGLWQKIRGNPLILTSAAYYANNVTGFAGAWMEKKQQNKLLEDITLNVQDTPNKKTRFWFGKDEKCPTYAAQKNRILSSRAFPLLDYGVYSFYAVANGALMMTDKGGGHGGGAGSGGIDAAGTVYAAAAEVLAGLPEEKREELLPKLAEHLRKARGLSPFAEDIEATLRLKVEALKSHPLTKNIYNPSPQPSPPGGDEALLSFSPPGGREKSHRDAVAASRMGAEPAFAV